MLIRLIVGLFIVISSTSCTTLRDLKLLQKNENTVLNEYGLIQHGYEPYRLQVDDFVSIFIDTNDPNASKFLGKQLLVKKSENQIENTGYKIQSDGSINILGLGTIYLEGLTQEQATEKVQKIVDETYNPGMAIARVSVENLNFIMMGEVKNEGDKKTEETTINLIEAVALSGGFTQFADRKNIHLWRQYPEGIKRVDLDITREDIANSPYFYLHPNDIIMVDPIPEKIIGIGGRSTWQDFTQFVSVVAYTIGTISLINRL